MTSTRSPFWAVAVALALSAGVDVSFARGSKQVDRNWLALTDCPDEPGCPAIVLLDDTELSNALAMARVSRRRLVKVFTDSAVAKYSNVEVIEWVGSQECQNLSGRTILPDGHVIRLEQDHVISKPLFRKGPLKVRSRSVNFPGVVKGAIIEVSYDLVFPGGARIRDLVWPVQDEIPVLKAHLTVMQGQVRFSSRASGPQIALIGRSQPKSYLQHFDAENVPSLPQEPFAPPVAEARTRLHLYEQSNWTLWAGAILGGVIGEYLESNAGIPERTSALVLPDDAPTTKVQRIYRFVQEKVGTDQERLTRTDKAGVTEARNVSEVLQRGFGDEFERTLLFLAMVRATGLPHALVLTPDRREGILDSQAPVPEQFRTFVAAVKTGGAWTFLDPAVKHCPFGMVASHKEGAAMIVTPRTPRSKKAPPLSLEEAIKELAASAPALTTIPFSRAADNVVTREAVVRLSEAGSAEVDVTEQTRGQSDLDRRDLYDGKSDGERLSTLSASLAESVPEARLLSASFEGFESFEQGLTIRYQLAMPATAVVAADRIILTPSLFGAAASNPFTVEYRQTPVHFLHAEKTDERIVFVLPAGYEPGPLPEGTIMREGGFLLVTTYQLEEGKLVFTRRLEIGVPIYPVESYPELKSFFEKAHQAEREVVTLQRRTAP